MQAINKVLDQIKGLRHSSVAKDTLWMFLAQGISFSCLMGYFLISARALGSDGYGAFSGLSALAAIVSPFAGWGAQNLIVKNVAVDRDKLGVSWGNGLVQIFISAVVLLLFAVPIVYSLFSGKVSTLAILGIFVADLVGLKILGVVEGAFISVNLYSWSAAARIILAVTKLILALVFLLLFKDTGIDGWSVIYCVATLLPTLLFVAVVTFKLAKPKVSWKLLKADFREGFYFAINASSENINASLDKSMLATLSSLSSAGLYSAAYRFIDFGVFPILSLQAATYPKFFRHGVTGLQGSWSFARRLLPAALAYGGSSAFAIFFIAPLFVPWVLGSEYADAAPVLRWLFPLHLLICLQFLVQDSLTGAGLQGIRSGIQVSAALLNFGLNYWLIPIFSWRGAAAATLTSEILKLVALYVILLVFLKRQRREVVE